MSPSIPVGSTMLPLEKCASVAPLPVAEPVGSSNTASAADALAAAAAALLAAANALRGSNVPPLSLHALPTVQGQSLSTNVVLDSPCVRAVVTMEKAREFWNVLPVDAPATPGDIRPA